MRKTKVSETMATETNKLPKTTKLIIGLLVVLVAILFWLVLRQPAQQSNSLLGDNVSIRQDQDKIQWKLPGSDWQTITTVSELTAGTQGQPGKDGQDGANGQDGTAGKDGVNGQNGTDGQDGATGAQGLTGTTGATGQDGADGRDGVDGAQGIQGIQGEQGTAGVDGQDGAQGIQGIQGEQGEQGTQGVAGIDGADGQAGIDGADGADGREIELQKDIYYIQWRYVGEPGWRNLIAYSDLKGDKGDKGDTGANGPANTLSIGSVTKPADCTPTASITGTAPNQTLNLGIPGLPTGGTAGQVLTKNSSDDCDAGWVTPAGETLIASWVQGDEDRVMVDSVDESTWTFHADNHGLQNNNRLYMMNDLTQSLVDPSKHLPANYPMNGDLGLVVINRTADTFQLSASSGGSSVNFAHNPDTDFSKVAFRRMGNRNAISVDIPATERVRVVARIAAPAFRFGLSVYPNTMGLGTDYVVARYTQASGTSTGVRLQQATTSAGWVATRPSSAVYYTMIDAVIDTALGESNGNASTITWRDNSATPLAHISDWNAKFETSGPATKVFIAQYDMRTKPAPGSWIKVYRID